MKNLTWIYENGAHKWGVIARDPERRDYIIDTNEYLVVSGDQALLTDPGGMEIFPAVFSAINVGYDPQKISRLFASHQDPDIISSLALWLDYKPDIKCYLSWLWGEFVPHFGGEPDTFILLPDEGQEIVVGRAHLQAIPAHYLHSSGNFHLYDPEARILFSGDVGAALLPEGKTGLYVEDFDSHIRHAAGFHRRWMGSNEAKLQWCERVASMAIDQLCPQHGAIYRGSDVMRFINWFSELEIGTAAHQNGTQR